MVPPSRLRSAPIAVGARPPVCSSLPAFAISCPSLPMAPIRARGGGAPRSKSLSAFTSMMNRTVSLLGSWVPSSLLHPYVERGGGKSTAGGDRYNFPGSAYPTARKDSPRRHEGHEGLRRPEALRSP